MEDGLDRAAVAVEPGGQDSRVDDLDDGVLGDIAPLLALPQPVADDHPGAPVAESGHEVGTDEAGSAGDQAHVGSSVVGKLSYRRGVRMPASQGSAALPGPY